MPTQIALRIASFVCVPCAAVCAPTLSNVAAVQQPDGSGGTEVVVSYDLVSPNGACDVSLSVSTDGGTTFAAQAAGASGAVGGGVSPGTGLEIAWPVAAQFPSATLANAMLRVVAADNTADLAITNAGFETDAQPNATLTVAHPPGWSTYGAIDNSFDVIGTLNPTTSTHYDSVPEGTSVGLVFLDGPTLAEAGMRQTLAATLGANRQYTLSAYVGNIDEGTANFGYFNLLGFPGYRVDLLAGTTMIASDNDTLNGSIPEAEWMETSITADIGSSHAELGQQLEIRLVNLNVSGPPATPGIEVNFDDIRLAEAAKMESASMLLETVAPSTGTATPPANATASPVAVPFSGATDASSGIDFVELWYRKDAGSWTNSGLAVNAAGGSFDFVPPGVAPASHGEYFFELVAQDGAGNRSAEPSGTSGTGQGSTTFDTGVPVELDAFAVE